MSSVHVQAFDFIPAEGAFGAHDAPVTIPVLRLDAFLGDEYNEAILAVHRNAEALKPPKKVVGICLAPVNVHSAGAYPSEVVA